MRDDTSVQQSFNVDGGSVLWLTGVSGAGKSTLAKYLQDKFHEQNEKVLVLDGDIVRNAIQDPKWQFDIESRRMGSYRYARLAQLAALQGITVIVPTISMFEDVREWNRENIDCYFEVYLTVELEQLKRRDPKALYREFSAGNNAQMVGLDVAIELPKHPDLVIDNNGELAQLQEYSTLVFDAFNAFRKSKKG